MNIMTVCGMGFGTSLMLKMTVDDILNEKGIKADVNANDAGSAKGGNPDLVIASADLESTLEGISSPKIFIDDLTNTEEIREKLLNQLKNMSD
ncbi:PTS sugar transporter subunit IIB [Virgibacillus sp. NKC19-3]|uniref:PTS sugar transporter subunit IIB n=1 Tax=Virgibacillus saliphilus TaxID=2831674 RepID=UPI001C9B094E|nr:PTS sugar transporter subunit IIB [Virgibacillus sp. NKC19-3]MBY7144557.1 PTS sugar transporter subunit IIB [Virgibacillus sp. NKC19-3]